MKRSACGVRSPTLGASCKACTPWGRARLGAGDRDDAERYFAEAEQLAESLGETLERAKIWHTRAELLLRDGEASRALELAASALETFTLSRTRYDITHARVTLSRTALASGG